MAEIKYYSKEGLQKLKDELHHMITVERPAISAAIAEQSYGFQRQVRPRIHYDPFRPQRP